MNFGLALLSLFSGHKMARSSWNNAEVWILIQHPDVDSKMTQPYIYMKTADAQLVPWVASQTDLLADDWGITGL